MKNPKQSHLTPRLFLVGVAFFSISCVAKRQAFETPNGVYGPNQEETAVAMGPAEVFGPKPDETYKKPKSFFLLLGPGLARGLAHVGVLSALEELNVPISGIAGVEMGALAAALRSVGNLNTLEWSMFKIRKKDLISRGVLQGAAAEGRVSNLKEYVEGAFKGKGFSSARIPLYVPETLRDSDEIHFENSGNLSALVTATFSVPGLIEPVNDDQKERVSSVISAPLPVSELKAMGFENVLCVDVLGSVKSNGRADRDESQGRSIYRPVAALIKRALASCDGVIKVSADAFDLMNFENRAELVELGKQAVKEWQRKNP